MKKATVSVIDDELPVRKSLAAVLSTYGYTVQTYGSASEFLRSDNEAPNCILLDINMPDQDGLTAQPSIQRKNPGVPIIVMTGYGSIPVAIQAIRQGASDFVEKPVDDAHLNSLLQAAIAVAQAKIREADWLGQLQKRYDELTPREKEVLRMVAEGHTSHSIGSNLGIAKKTADHHRSNIMAKMQATSAGQVIRFYLKLHPEG
jgi:FixJ family two-component response regulator